MEEALIAYQNVEIYRDEFEVLNEVDFTLQKGEFVYLIGKVGSGKSSLLKTMYGEVDIKKGKAKVFDYNIRKLKRKHVPQLRRRLGIVFQDFKLLTDRSVFDNLSFVLRATGWKSRKEIKKRVEETLEMVGMGQKGYKWPNELSGGEQQRIVIARAVLNSPDIILADEPTGNLDVETGRQIVELLHNISQSGTAVVMTTHNLQLISEYPGKVYCCKDRELTNVSTDFNPQAVLAKELEADEEVDEIDEEEEAEFVGEAF